MNELVGVSRAAAGSVPADGARERRGAGRRLAGAAALLLLAAGGAYAVHRASQSGPAAPPTAPPPPRVTVSEPLQAAVQRTERFLGQFSVVDSVALRAQVGGTLTSIAFKDGQVVHAGDPLFSIDPRPFKIRLDGAVAQFQTAMARQTLAASELWRAPQLTQGDFGSVQNVESRSADARSAEAAIDTAKAAIADARLDLEFATITAPFTGRMGARQVSLGSLVSGSRGGTGQSTLMATIVSLDPIYLNFQMSEADYAAYQAVGGGTAPHADVAISLDGGGRYDGHGTLDFIDNVVDRSSGTIAARATVPNPTGAITPGQFARLRLDLGRPAPAMLVPAAAVIPDQSRQVVMTVAPDGTVVPKLVETGDLQHGLRVILSGLAPTDRVVIDGIVRVRPGAKVNPVAGQIKPDPTAN